MRSKRRNPKRKSVAIPGVWAAEYLPRIVEFMPSLGATHAEAEIDPDLPEGGLLVTFYLEEGTRLVFTFDRKAMRFSKEPCNV